MPAIIVFMILSILLFNPKEAVKIELKFVTNPNPGFDFDDSGKLFPKEVYDF